MESETWTSDGVVEDTRRGLQDNPKWLSSLYFYDEEGSRLFDALCETPEYYPTRTEHAILADNAYEILARVGDDLTLAELGSGSSSKTRVLLDALLERQGPSDYLPVDVSADFLAIAERLQSQHPGLSVHPIAAEYSNGLDTIGAYGQRRRLVLFLGSSLGNFEPKEQEELLARACSALQPGDAFLLGTDLVKDQAVLEAAYNDADGITAQFNLNILTHLNRRLQGDADISKFEHKAFWNPAESRIEMHLVSREDQTLRFGRAEIAVAIAGGETIHTENSYKFTAEGARELATRAGFTYERSWTDDNDWFALHLLRV